jgi:hypothetical protein
LPGLLGEHAAGFGEDGGSAGAVEELYVLAAFEGLHGGADGGLDATEFSACGGEAAGLLDGDQDAKLVEGQGGEQDVISVRRAWVAASRGR